MEKLKVEDPTIGNGSEDLLPRDVAQMFIDEYRRATKLFKPFNSAHEGWAVIKEEMDELWEEVTRKAAMREPERLTTEAVQIGAMAMRFIIDICLVKPEGVQLQFARE